MLAEKHYRVLQNPPPLEESSTRVYAYGETSPIETLGEIKTHLAHKSATCSATLIVVKTSTTSLFSWKTSQKLNLLSHSKDIPSDSLSRQTSAVTEKSRREERVKEEHINYIANTSTPKAMTLAELEASTARDHTLPAAIEAVRSGKWCSTSNNYGVNTATFDKLHKLQSESSVTESGKLILRGTRIIVPPDLQQRAVELAHTGHQFADQKRHTKSEPEYDPKPWKVTKQNRSMITVERNGRTVTRKSSRFKPSPRSPEETADESDDDIDVPFPPPNQAPRVQPQLPPPPAGRPQHQRRRPA
jgi:hypothetical protein